LPKGEHWGMFLYAEKMGFLTKMSEKQEKMGKAVDR
jgi:hypothetical protein